MAALRRETDQQLLEGRLAAEAELASVRALLLLSANEHHRLHSSQQVEEATSF